MFCNNVYSNCFIVCLLYQTSLDYSATSAQQTLLTNLESDEISLETQSLLIQSRLDLAKERYRGPFSTEQVGCQKLLLHIKYSDCSLWYNSEWWFIKPFITILFSFEPTVK